MESVPDTCSKEADKVDECLLQDIKHAYRVLTAN